MISKYLKSKNLISQIKPTIDESKINDDNIDSLFKD